MQHTRLGILIASLQAGGAERAALGLFEEFSRAGVETSLLTLHCNREMLETLEPEPRGLVERRLTSLGSADIRSGTLLKTLLGPWHLLRLAGAKRRLRLDVVLSIMERANILNLLTPGGARRVVSIRSFPSLLMSSKTPLKRWLVERLYGFLLRRADRIVVVSREAAMDVERLHPEVSGRCDVIYNTCDVERLQARARAPLPAEHAALFDNPVVLAGGRMKPEKGHWHLLRAFAEVARQEPSVRLVLLGDGPLRPDLLGLRDKLGLEDRVFFPGFQSNVLPWVSGARVFVLPSVWEGFPNSLLEALAVGTPVVASDCRSGPRELLAPESDPTRKTTGIDETPSGFLVAAPDGVRRPAGQDLTVEERLLAEAIVRSLRVEGGTRSALPPRERLAEFAPERIIKRWMDLLAG